MDDRGILSEAIQVNIAGRKLHRGACFRRKSIENHDERAQAVSMRDDQSALATHNAGQDGLDERTIQVLRDEIWTQEERARVFKKTDPLYPILARTLGKRCDNLAATVATLGRRLSEIEATTAEAA